MELITRKQAKAKGLKRYFTGVPCKHGHISDRHVSTAACRECARLKSHKKQREIPEYFQERKLLKKYGLTLIDYNNLLKVQEYRCAICQIHQDELKRKLDVDHNHKTGENRGLLCTNCNRALGKLKDRATICVRAAEYLLKYNCY